MPIWAFIIWKFVRFGSAKSLFAIEVVLFVLTAWLAFNPLQIPKITRWLHWYSFFLMAYILIFTVRFSYAQLNKILALGLWMVFIAGDWWEYPIFFYDFFGWVNGFHFWHVDLWTWLSSHIHRAYVLASLVLMWKMAGLKVNRCNLLLVFLGTVISFAALYPYAGFAPLVNSVHVLCLSLFGGIVYFGGGKLADP